MTPTHVIHTVPRWRRTRRIATIVGFLLPFLVPFIAFYLAPFIYAVSKSLQVIRRTGGIFGYESTHYGLAQYREVAHDTDFWLSVVRVSALGLVQVPIMICLAVLLGLLLDSPMARGRRFFRVIYFLPFAIPGVIAAIMWGALLSPQTTPIGFFETHNLLDRGLVLAAIGNIGVWTYAGSNTIIVSSALTAVPPEVLEAARIDGASNVKIGLAIKLPLILPTVLFSAILNLIGALQLLAEPLVFRTLTPNISSTYTPNMIGYNAAVSNNYEYAAAVSVTLAIITFVASLVLMRRLQRVMDQ